MKACERAEAVTKLRRCPQAPFGTRFSSPLKDAHFSVRTLEKGAHLRRNHRGFPRCALFEKAAHLRTTCAPSAGPRPSGTRSRVRCRCCVKSCWNLLRPRSRCVASKRIRSAAAHDASLGAGARALPWDLFCLLSQPFAFRILLGRNKKSRALSEARLRLCEIYSSRLYRISSFLSRIIADRGGPVQDQYF